MQYTAENGYYKHCVIYKQMCAHSRMANPIEVQKEFPCTLL